jgi:antitoxin component of MazEF toxin-antitoxin module
MTKIYMTKHGQVVVTLPKAIAKAKQLQHKQEVEWVLDGAGNLILRAK